MIFLMNKKGFQVIPLSTLIPWESDTFFIRKENGMKLKLVHLELCFNMDMPMKECGIWEFFLWELVIYRIRCRILACANWIQDNFLLGNLPKIHHIVLLPMIMIDPWFFWLSISFYHLDILCKLLPWPECPSSSRCLRYFYLSFKICLQ